MLSKHRIPEFGNPRYFHSKKAALRNIPVGRPWSIEDGLNLHRYFPFGRGITNGRRQQSLFDQAQGEGNPEIIPF